MTLSSIFLATLVILEFHFGSADWASLAVSTSSSQWKEFCAIFNPKFTTVSTARSPSAAGDRIPAVYSDQDTFGCTDLPSNSLDGNASIVSRGNCTFVQKALVAQSAGAPLLVVVYNESKILTIPDLQVNGSTSVNIPVLLISNVSGENITGLMKESLVYITVYNPTKPLFDPSVVVMFAIAVTTVLLAAYIANTPFEFLRYGLLFRKSNKTTNSQQSEKSTNNLSVCAAVITVLIMLVTICSFLTLLYYFYYPMVYIALGFYVLAATAGLYNLFSPFVSLIPTRDRCRFPNNKLPILMYRPDPLFFITVLFSICVVVWWLVERHSSYAWIIQNFLGFAFIAYLLNRLNFLQVWIVALLMAVLFFYDIFMVFITPYFTDDHVSVMEKAATGPRGYNGGGGPSETLPVVFTVPRLIYPSRLESVCPEYFSRPYSLLGYGDVGIPGLLVTLCLKFDYQFHSTKYCRLYYGTSGIAYAVGLLVTFVALALMKSAQPALLYLVPTTLGSVIILSLLKGEFVVFFTGKSYSEYKKKRKSNSVDDNSRLNSETESETEADPHETTQENQVLISTEL